MLLKSMRVHRASGQSRKSVGWAADVEGSSEEPAGGSAEGGGPATAGEDGGGSVALPSRAARPPTSLIRPGGMLHKCSGALFRGCLGGFDDREHTLPPVPPVPLEHRRSRTASFAGGAGRQLALSLGMRPHNMAEYPVSLNLLDADSQLPDYVLAASNQPPATNPGPLSSYEPAAFLTQPELLGVAGAPGLPKYDSLLVGASHSQACLFSCVRSPHLKSALLSAALWCGLWWIALCTGPPTTGGLNCVQEYPRAIRWDDDAWESWSYYCQTEPDFAASHGCCTCRHLFWGGTHAFLTALLVAILVLYMLESFFSHSHKWLKEAAKPAEGAAGASPIAGAHIEEVRQAAPQITFHLSTYHYETAHDKSSHVALDGKVYHRFRTRTDKVETHSVSAPYPFTWSRDVSPGSDAYGSWGYVPMTRVEFSQAVAFADHATRDHYLWHKREFIHYHSAKDVHFDFHVTVDIPGYRRHLLIDLFPGARPRWLTMAWFWVSTLLLLSLPYRLLFSLTAAKRRYVFIKEIKAAPQADQRSANHLSERQ